METIRRALARRVLVVVETRVDGTWVAFIDAVPGENHDNEEAEVLRSGTKLQENIARLLFGYFENMPYAN